MGEKKLAGPIIVGAALIVSAAVFGLFFWSARTGPGNDTLAVTGSAKSRVTSDQAKLVVSFSRIMPESALAAGYTSIARDNAAVRGVMKKAGFDDKDISENTISMNQLYDQNGPSGRYQFTQTVTLQSGDVAKVTELSKNVTDLAGQGIVVNVQSLEYYYSQLPDLRVSLLTDAVKDAKARAAKIAEGTGRHVGDVQSASVGVVQVMAPNSVDVSDYGSYDTSSVEKDVMVTVKASFRLK
jgi:uncharacterized protein